MPAGVDHPFLGGLAFAAIKLAGYCLAARMIGTSYQKDPPRWFAIGFARTTIGFAFGYPYFQWATGAFQSLSFMLGLIPIRIIEWLLLLILFYDHRLQNRPRAGKVAALGTLWSFLLDLPATVGWILVAGFWVC